MKLRLVEDKELPMKNNITVLSHRVKDRTLKRGDIYYADLCGIEQSLGSEQTGIRPVLIIQNDIGICRITSPLKLKTRRQRENHSKGSFVLGRSELA